MADRLEFNTPVGRFVSGHPTEKQTTDFQGRPVAPDKQRISVGIAFPKGQNGIDELLGRIYNYGLQCYAAIPGGQRAYAEAQRWLDPNAAFSWKIKDGDLPNQDGTVNEHTRGSWVFYFSTTLPFKACNGLAANAEMPAGDIKRGWYVDMFANCSPNNLTDNNAGIYMNPSIMRLCGYGQEIVGGPSIAQAFGNAPAPVLPQGASTVPLAPAGAAPAGLPGAPVPGGQPPAYTPPAPQQAYQPQPAPAAQPAYAPPPTAAPAPAALPGFPPAQPIGNTLPGTGYPSNVQPHPTFVPGAPPQAAPVAPQQPAYAPPGINPATGLPY